MKRSVWAMASIVATGMLTACGNVPFEGVYEGEIKVAYSCRWTQRTTWGEGGGLEEDGEQDKTVNLRFRDTDDGVEWTACGEEVELVKSKVDGDTVTAGAITCPDSRYGDKITLENVKVSLKDEKLTFDWLRVERYDSQYEKGFCRFQYAGTIPRVGTL